MYCKFCGNRIVDGSRFCTGCGAKIDDEQQSANPSYGAQNYQPLYQQPTYYTREQNTLAILGLVFAFIFTPVGLGLSIAGFRKSHELNGDGRGLALAGIIVSAVCLGLSVFVLIPLIVVFATYYPYYSLNASAELFSQILGAVTSIL